MATKTTDRREGDVAQETVDRIRELNERAIENARKAGETYLDAYERSLKTIVDHQKSMSAATPIDWLQRMLDAQAAFTREVGELYASAAREAMKKN